MSKESNEFLDAIEKGELDKINVYLIKKLVSKEFIEKIAYFVCEKGNKETLLALIQNGLDINVKNSEGKTLLEIAIEENNKDIVLLLIEHGIQQTGEELLLLARHAKANPNSIEMAKILLDSSSKAIDINKKYENRVTPLMSSIQQGNFELACFLIDRGSHINLANAMGWRIIDFAFDTGNKVLLDKIKQRINIDRKNKGDVNTDTVSQMEEKEYNEKCNLIKDAGHILGLSHETVGVKLPNTNHSVNISYEGSLIYRSMISVLKLLKKYLKHNNIAFSKDDQNNFKEIIDIIERMMNLTPYEPGKINLISSGWSKHAIVLGFYKDNVIVANRGAGKKENETGLNIFHVEHIQNKIISDGSLKDLSNFNSQHNEKTILEKIDALIPNRASKIAIKSKDQRHGNCSFVNLKSMVQALLFILKKQNLTKSNNTSNEWSAPRIQLEALEYAQKEYKKFTNFIRDTFLKKIINAYKNPKSEEYKNIYKHILITYLSQHHGAQVRSDEKRGKELEKVFKILSAFNIKTRMELIESMDNQFKAVSGAALLCTAVQFGNLELVKLLIETGIAINIRSVEGRTPLMLAAIQNRAEIVSYLLDNGANPSLVDNTGFSVLHFAAQLGTRTLLLPLLPS